MKTPQLDIHIAELLALYDCVIVPQFGGFIGNEVPAQLDEVDGKISPPSKALLFNKNLNANDGLLANHLVQMHSLSFADALSTIREEVMLYNSVLQAGKRLELRHLGVLYLDDEKNMQFHANGNAIVLANSFGFSSIVLPEQVVAEVPATIPFAAPVETEVVKESIAPAAQVVVLEQAKQRRRWPMLGAASVILIGAFYLWHIPTNTSYQQTGRLQLGHFNPFHSAKSFPNSTYSPTTNRAVIADMDLSATNVLDENASEFDWEYANHSKKVHFAEELATPIEPTSTGSKSKKYQVICGCFGVEENARNFVTTLQSEGFDAWVVDHHKGLWRVSANGYTSRAEAKKVLKSLKKEGRSAWILKKS